MLNTRDIRGLDAAERFVSAQQAAGNDVWWEGFDKMVFFRPEEKGRSSRDGAFRNGVWGFRNVVEVDENGVWKVDYRNVRRIKRTRN